MSQSVTTPTANELSLEVIANRCSGGACPTIYQTNRGTLVVQGYSVSPEQVALPDGETLVEIPVELVLEAHNRMTSIG